MPVSKALPVMRYEPSIDEADFRPQRKSGIVTKAKKVKPRKEGRGKRSVEDMMASMDNDASKAKYALERIQALEDQIAKILEYCGPDALAIVLKARSSLAKYAPEK